MCAKKKVMALLFTMVLVSFLCGYSFLINKLMQLLTSFVITMNILITNARLFSSMAIKGNFIFTMGAAKVNY
jgi:hypothetical protein